MHVEQIFWGVFQWLVRYVQCTFIFFLRAPADLFTSPPSGNPSLRGELDLSFPPFALFAHPSFLSPDTSVIVPSPSSSSRPTPRSSYLPFLLSLR